MQPRPIDDPDERGFAVRLTLAILGLEILDVELTTDPDDSDAVKAYGDVVSAATAEAGVVPNRDGYEDRTGFR